jgi:hypothetical protein
VATVKTVGGVVDAPPIAAAPFGLINKITLGSEAERWEGGISWQSLDCAAKVDLWGACDPNETNVIDGTGKNQIIYAPPIGITATHTCTSTFGADFREKANEQVLNLLDASTQKALEFELKWGPIASTSDPIGRWLTDANTVVVDASGVSPKAATAMLEDAYAACGYGGYGVLHVTRGTATSLGSSIDEETDILYTPVGTMVIAGAGYSTPNPAGAGAWDGTWAFITGSTQVWLGDPSVYPETLNQAVNIATNDIFFKAERLAAAAYDGCCVFAVKVDLTQA